MNSVVSVRRNNSLFCTGRFRGRPLLLVECIQGTLGPINGFGLSHVYRFRFRHIGLGFRFLLALFSSSTLIQQQFQQLLLHLLSRGRQVSGCPQRCLSDGNDRNIAPIFVVLSRWWQPSTDLRAYFSGKSRSPLASDIHTGLQADSASFASPAIPGKRAIVILLLQF